MIHKYTMTHIHDIHTSRWTDTCKDTVTNEQTHRQVVNRQTQKEDGQALKRTDGHTETLNMDRHTEQMQRMDGH